MTMKTLQSDSLHMFRGTEQEVRGYLQEHIYKEEVSLERPLLSAP